MRLGRCENEMATGRRGMAKVLIKGGPWSPGPQVLLRGKLGAGFVAEAGSPPRVGLEP